MSQHPQGCSRSERSAVAVTSIDDAITAHDSRISDSGVEMWLGAEPTFTDRDSAAAEWQTAALGLDKEQRARQFVARLATGNSGGAILRTLGRQYPGEATPRWSFGIYSRRDGQPVWNGPLDPVTRSSSPTDPPTEQRALGSADTQPVPAKLRDALETELRMAGLSVSTKLPADSWGARLLLRNGQNFCSPTG
ncbi:MAG: transglutaminase family protein [Rhodopirellula sp.]|nr:transglutaminase family protein [Rhodopirellula sp.]